MSRSTGSDLSKTLSRHQETVGRRNRHRSSVLYAIRRHCLDCMGNYYKAVAECPNTKCRLWPFRYGVKPETASKQGRNVSPGGPEGPQRTSPISERGEQDARHD